ncbi:unnamed protein product [Rhizoctonia solani]|uniref:Uncharacterized protein n=1 Tax=Rhizoctonia solani TaxID=456999 RepID=A0A8H2XCX0_9AGAM|nr:unnamed protein product [Rhizoctonia solani]
MHDTFKSCHPVWRWVGCRVCDNGRVIRLGFWYARVPTLGIGVSLSSSLVTHLCASVSPICTHHNASVRPISIPTRITHAHAHILYARTHFRITPYLTDLHSLVPPIDSVWMLLRNAPRPGTLFHHGSDPLFSRIVLVKRTHARIPLFAT